MDTTAVDDSPTTATEPAPAEVSAPATPQLRVLSREDILNASDTQTQSVEVPEWGGLVWVRGLTGAGRDAFEASMIDQKKKGKSREVNLQNLRAKLVALSVVMGPEKGAALMFQPSDVEALGQKSALALQRVFAVAQEISGLKPEDVEDLTEELGEDSSGDSGSS